MSVVDASAILELLLNTAAGERVSRRLARERHLYAPYLIDIEVASALRRFRLNGQIVESEGLSLLADLGDFRIVRYSHIHLLPRIWELCQNLTAYDAAYVALAEALDAPLITCDRKLAGAPGHRVRVEVV